MIEKVIYSVLTTTTAVTDNLNSTTSVYPFAIPQGQGMPAITYQRTDNDPEDTKDGVSDLDNIFIDVDMWVSDAESPSSDAYTDIKTLSDAVRDALDRYSGTVSGVTVQSIQFQSDSEDYDGEVYHITHSYKVRHKI